MNRFENKSIVLFDGICNLCNSNVNFIIDHDKKEQFLFASLQSDAAKDILLHFPTKKILTESIVLIHEGNLYQKSTAIFLIYKHLDFPYPILHVGYFLPVKFRDWWYDLIAKNRYKWWGKRDVCRIPEPHLKGRFLP